MQSRRSAPIEALNYTGGDSPLVRTNERRRRKSLKTLERVKGIEPSSSAWKALAIFIGAVRERAQLLERRRRIVIDM
jgi:hypothetical protein